MTAWFIFWTALFVIDLKEYEADRPRCKQSERAWRTLILVFEAAMSAWCWK
jgi:hypothetical protein